MSSDEQEPVYPLRQFRVVVDEGNPFVVLLEFHAANGVVKYYLRQKQLENLATECANAVAMLRDLT